MNPPPRPPLQFVNEVRLNLRQWLITLAVVVVVVVGTPVVWEHVEKFPTGPDYRIPYALSKDYWLYGRRMRQVKDPATIVVVGDSVVWGEYVLPDGTLSHFLSQDAERRSEQDTPKGPRKPARHFVNGGVNGLFPLALEGLIHYYGDDLENRKVLLHCNLLWMSSPKADLQVRKEEKFNHPRLVPQFHPWIPCYREDMNTRLGIEVERHVPFLAWVSHLQNAYFDQKNILEWTLADDGRDPPSYPNAFKNPLARIRLEVPGPPAHDPERGPDSPRHRPWSTGGIGATRFEWVDLDSSLQWAAFQRLTRLLEQRHNQVLVVIGPFNEHMMAPENLPAYRKLRGGVEEWFHSRGTPCLAPEPLPSDVYADASHPLTQGYELLAEELRHAPAFREWLAKPKP